MNYTSARLPEAYVAVGKNKNRLKIYGTSNVFLKDGEEFQIELFNPTTKTIAAKILINGVSISNSLLVIKPGERSYLERYLDDNRKFVFETYNVENSKDSKEAIKNNGGIKVEFYNEKAPITPLNICVGNTGTINVPYYNYSNPFTTNDPGFYGISTSGNVGIGATTPTASFYVGNTDSTFAMCSNSGTVTTAIADNSAYTTGFATGISGAQGPVGISGASASLETGRIEKGDVSNQTFGNYYGDFESYYFASTEYKLLPNSQKPIEVKEIRQYCGSCRNRIKKASWKWCPSCGEKLD